MSRDEDAIKGIWNLNTLDLYNNVMGLIKCIMHEELYAAGFWKAQEIG